VRSVPLIDQAARALDGLSRREHFTDPDDLVFIGTGGEHFDDSALRRRFVKALHRSGLKRLRFHDLRHTFDTIAVQAFPLTDVKAYMGHADIATTMVYVHHVPQADAADKDECRQRLDRAGGPRRHGVNQSFITGASPSNLMAAETAHLYWTILVANSFSDKIARADLSGANVNPSFSPR